MDGTALKTDRILKIYSQLVNGIFCAKKNWRSNFMSRSGVSNVTWKRCAVFLQRKGCNRISSTTERKRLPAGESLSRAAE